MSLGFTVIFVKNIMIQNRSQDAGVEKVLLQGIVKLCYALSVCKLRATRDLGNPRN